jgi:hypothetical protein
MCIDRRLMPKMISSNVVIATDLRVPDRLANVISMFIAQNMPLMVTLAAALSSNTLCGAIAQPPADIVVGGATTADTTASTANANVGTDSSSSTQSLPISAVAPKVIAQVNSVLLHIYMKKVLSIAIMPVLYMQIVQQVHRIGNSTLVSMSSDCV